MGSTMADDVSGELRPGETRKFVYLGSQVPNVVNVQNMRRRSQRDGAADGRVALGLRDVQQR
jgi:hypothetical protein